MGRDRSSDGSRGADHAEPAASGAEVVAGIRRDAGHLPRLLRDRLQASGVLEAIAAVPRHVFVPDELSGRACEDRPLPIGFGQTISQPLIVALMTALIEPHRHDRVLEIGTGSGYQAAVLSRLVSRVVTVEVIPQLAERSGEALAALGIANVEQHCADGRQGWAPGAPYDGIVITACARRLPRTVVAQLAPGGRLVAPIGGPSRQDLILVRRRPDGKLSAQRVLPVRFVPLT